MPTLYVYLFENGKEDSFAQLSGQELESIQDATDMEFDTDHYDDEDKPLDYATVSVSDEDAARLLGKRITITPEQYGLHKWGKVELLFLASPNRHARARAKAAQGLFELGPKGIPRLNPDVESKVGEFLTGERGTLGQQRRKLKIAVTGKEGGTRKRKTKTRGKKTRKTRGRK